MATSLVSCFFTHGVVPKLSVVYRPGAVNCTAVIDSDIHVLYINLYSPINGSNTKTQQYKHKYKQNASNGQVYHK